MPKPRQLYSLYSRSITLVDGKKVSMYYYRTYDEAGKLRSFATGKRKKSEALAFVLDRVKNGSLVPTQKAVVTVQDYAKEFWVFEGKRVQGALLRKRITPAYCTSMNGILNNHWFPKFGELRLDGLTVTMIETLITEKSKTLSAKMVNHIVMAMRAVYDEAVRLGDLEVTPFEKVQLVQVRTKGRGMLTPEEGFKVLADPEHFGSPVLWALNITAATTGARAGELRGLKVKHVHNDRIEIAGSIRAEVGFVEDTKSGKFRWISLPQKTAKVLEGLKEGKEPDDLVFGKLSVQSTSESLSDALEKAKIMTKAQRLVRKVDFHSWRHWFNSMIRGRASDVALRSATGHSTAAMTENYSHQIESHLVEVRKAQDEAFSGLAAQS